MTILYGDTMRENKEDKKSNKISRTGLSSENPANSNQITFFTYFSIFLITWTLAIGFMPRYVPDLNQLHY